MAALVKTDEVEDLTRSFFERLIRRTEDGPECLVEVIAIVDLVLVYLFRDLTGLVD